MEEKYLFGIITIIVLAVLLTILAYLGIDGQLTALLVSLITSVIGAILGLSVNIKTSLEEYVKLREKQLSTPNVDLKARVEELELWKGKVHSLLVGKNKKGEETATAALRQIGKAVKF